MNYYYWGYFVIACVNRVAAIVPTTAFNLAVPMFFALTFTGAFSMGYNLASGVKHAGRRGVVRSRTGEANRLTNRLLPPVLCGATTALFVSVIANVDGAIQLVQGFWAVAVKGEAWVGFDFWRSSRMIPPLESFEPPSLAFWLPDHIPGNGGASWHITEFPYFTFLFADLHAHMMAIPFTLLGLGLGWRFLSGFAMDALPGWLRAVRCWPWPLDRSGPSTVGTIRPT